MGWWRYHLGWWASYSADALEWRSVDKLKFWIFTPGAHKKRRTVTVNRIKLMTSSDILFDLIERVSVPSSHDSILVSLIWWKSGKAQKAFLMIKISFVPICHCPERMNNLTLATSFLLYSSCALLLKGSWRVKNSFLILVCGPVSSTSCKRPFQNDMLFRFSVSLSSFLIH